MVNLNSKHSPTRLVMAQIAKKAAGPAPDGYDESTAPFSGAAGLPEGFVGEEPEKEPQEDSGLITNGEDWHRASDQEKFIDINTYFSQFEYTGGTQWDEHVIMLSHRFDAKVDKDELVLAATNDIEEYAHMRGFYDKKRV